MLHLMPESAARFLWCSWCLTMSSSFSHDCDSCLSLISDKRQLTLSQSVYIVVKKRKHILIIKTPNENTLFLCFLCAEREHIDYNIDCTCYSLICYCMQSLKTYSVVPTLVGTVGKDKEPCCKLSGLQNKFQIRVLVLLAMKWNYFLSLFIFYYFFKTVKTTVLAINQQFLKHRTLLKPLGGKKLQRYK